MFKQVEYSEILFKNSLLNFGRCAHDGSLIGNEPPYRSRLMYQEQLIIFFELLKFGRCAHDGSLIGNELPYR